MSSVTASFTAAFLKNAVMNLAEPSGSSPPEKPPGMNIIWAWPVRLCKVLHALGDGGGVRFRTTIISGSAPAFSKARAESYSQLVPGNTGMSTRGRAVFTAGTGRDPASYENAGTGSSGIWILQGNTGSSLPS
jgi:hypothetical protein